MRHDIAGSGLPTLHIGGPSGEEAFAEVMAVFAHELTHHWLWERGPRIEPPAEPSNRTARPGYWIVEGFASLIEDFVWDPRARTFRTENPRSDRLDMLANTQLDQRLSWPRLFQLTHIGFANLSKKASVRVASSWYLGRYRAVSQGSVFYAQAASACHYLFHAEEGAHRQALLRYVVDYYSAHDDKLDADDFGASWAKLGIEVVRWTKARVVD